MIISKFLYGSGILLFWKRFGSAQYTKLISSYLSDLVIEPLNLLSEMTLINIIRQISKQERSIQCHSSVQANGKEDLHSQPNYSSNIYKENQPMLSTSTKTKFQYQYLLIAVVILAMVSVIALYQSGIMPKFSAVQSPAAVDLSWPPRPDYSQLNEIAMIPVTGSADSLAVYHSGGWGGPVAVQQSLDLYYLSERVQANLSK
jgi:hypothetical protein